MQRPPSEPSRLAEPPRRPRLDVRGEDVPLPSGNQLADWANREGRPAPSWGRETDDRTWNPG